MMSEMGKRGKVGACHECSQKIWYLSLSTQMPPQDLPGIISDSQIKKIGKEREKNENETRGKRFLYLYRCIYHA